MMQFLLIKFWVNRRGNLRPGICGVSGADSSVELTTVMCSSSAPMRVRKRIKSSQLVCRICCPLRTKRAAFCRGVSRKKQKGRPSGRPLAIRAICCATPGIARRCRENPQIALLEPQPPEKRETQFPSLTAAQATGLALNPETC
jgi:hypothetical protein